MKSGIYPLKENNETPKLAYCQMEVDGYDDPAIEQRLGYWELSSYSQGEVYFSARKTDIGDFTGKITFNEILINKGNGFTGTTGVFRAPTSGFYSFTISGRQNSHNNEGALYIDVLRNGSHEFYIVDTASNSEHGYYNALSFTFQLYLSKNDYINLEVNPNDIMYASSSYPMYFSGYLIYAE